MQNGEIAQPRLLLLKLVLPPLIPLALIAILLLGSWLGHEWNAHGDGLVLGVLSQISGLIVFIYELTLMPKAIAALSSLGGSENVLNRTCLFLALLFLAFCLAGVVYIFFF